MSAPGNDLLRFSLRGMLVVTAAIALAAGMAVAFPTVTFLGAFFTLFTALHFPQPFLRYFPRTTLLFFGIIGLVFIGGGFYAGVTTGQFGHSFVARVTMGSLLLLITWLFYIMVKRREI